MTLAAAYIRFDTSNHLTGQLSAYHLRQLFFCAKNRHCRIIRKFQDIGYPTSYCDRPGLKSMLEWMEKEKVFFAYTPSASHILKGLHLSRPVPAQYFFFCLKENLLLPLPVEILSQ